MISEKNFLRVFWPCFIRYHITLINKSTRAGVFLFAFFLNLFFGLFSGLFRGFYITKGIICGFEVLDLWLRLFDFRIFYESALSLYLDRGDICKTIASQSLVVHLFDVGCRLEICFGPSFNHFLNYLFPDV